MSIDPRTFKAVLKLNTMKIRKNKIINPPPHHLLKYLQEQNPETRIMPYAKK